MDVKGPGRGKTPRIEEGTRKLTKAPKQIVEPPKVPPGFQEASVYEGQASLPPQVEKFKTDYIAELQKEGFTVNEKAIEQAVQKFVQHQARLAQEQEAKQSRAIEDLDTMGQLPQLHKEGGPFVSFEADGTPFLSTRPQDGLRTAYLLRNLVNYYEAQNLSDKQIETLIKAVKKIRGRRSLLSKIQTFLSKLGFTRKSTITRVDEYLSKRLADAKLVPVAEKLYGSPLPEDTLLALQNFAAANPAALKETLDLIKKARKNVITDGEQFGSLIVRLAMAEKIFEASLSPEDEIKVASFFQDFSRRIPGPLDNYQFYTNSMPLLTSQKETTGPIRRHVGAIKRTRELAETNKTLKAMLENANSQKPRAWGDKFEMDWRRENPRPMGQEHLGKFNHSGWIKESMPTENEKKEFKAKRTLGFMEGDKLQLGDVDLDFSSLSKITPSQADGLVSLITAAAEGRASQKDSQEDMFNGKWSELKKTGEAFFTSEKKEQIEGIVYKFVEALEKKATELHSNLYLEQGE